MEGMSKGIANAGIKSRIKQILVLVLIIMIGILISQAVQAQSYHKSKARHYKAKYRSQIKTNNRACAILVNKRAAETRQPLFASFKRKPKHTPQAEVDGPSYSRVVRKESIIITENQPVVAGN